MKSRLDALLRQRELLREHAQWLEDEIATERARGVAPSLSSSATSTIPDVPNAALPVLTTLAPAEPDIKGLHNEVRRGCLVYFLIAAAALGGVIAFIYWKYGQRTEPDVSPAPIEAPSPAAGGGTGLH